MDVREIVAFVAVARWSSFTRAAQQLGMPKQTLSRKVRSLERRLGVRLLDRTTRSVGLTDAGRRLLDRASDPLERIERAVEEVRATEREPAGELRIACPQLFGRSFLPSVIDRYLERYPDASVSVRLVDAITPPTWEGLDVLVHVGDWRDSPAKRTSLGQAINHCYASPAYLDRVRTPAEPEDLSALDGITYTREASRATWTLRRGRHRRRVVIRSRLKVNDAELALGLVLAGRGVAQLPRFLCDPHVAAGTLVRLLPDWRVEIGPIVALTRPDARRPAKVEAFLRLLGASVRGVTERRGA
ncbi:MAG TPA: LysR substrate-binding domain-containing protein [Candidatus Polarisedimenticolaceae bacterium]